MLRGKFEIRPGQYPNDLFGVFGQYVRAVEYLFEAMQRTSFSADHCSYPILYLMRHTLEVGLKANIQCISIDVYRALDKKKLSQHELGYLIDQFVGVVENKLLESDDLGHFRSECSAMRELVDFMPSASSFRYTHERGGEPVFRLEVFDLERLRLLFNRSQTILAYTPAVLFGA